MEIQAVNAKRLYLRVADQLLGLIRGGYVANNSVQAMPAAPVQRVTGHLLESR